MKVWASRSQENGRKARASQRRQAEKKWYLLQLVQAVNFVDKEHGPPAAGFMRLCPSNRLLNLSNAAADGRQSYPCVAVGSCKHQVSGPGYAYC